MTDWLERGRSHVWRPYTQMATAAPPLPVVKTEGSRIHLADGRVLVDGLASWWTACHGYNHPVIREAVAAQLGLLPHVMFGGLAHEPGYRLAEALATMLPGDLDHVFFSDSGSVAVEVALKIALQYWQCHGHPEKRRFLAFQGGYHGDTFMAMSVCDPEEGMHRRFAGTMPVQDVLPLPKTPELAAQLERHLDQHASELAAVIVEPLLQGAGGMHVHSAECLRTLTEQARARGLLVIYDEIATGFGRTGTMFAMEQAQVTPDLVCLSKALTAGTLPMAATVASREVYEAFLGESPARALMHGPTFMGNPLAASAALASIELFGSEARLEEVPRIESQLRAELGRLGALPGVRAVRVLGAMGAVELEAIADLEGLRQRFVAEGVWVRPLGNVVYLMPALNIEPGELSVLTAAVQTVLDERLRG